MISSLRELFPSLESLVSNIENKENCLDLSTLISLLHGLHTIEIPWDVMSSDTREGMIMAVSIALYNDDDINYIENYNKNYKNNNLVILNNNDNDGKNEFNTEKNHPVASTPTLAKTYNSVGLDVLYYLSQIGCKSNDTKNSIINDNFLIFNSCNIILVSETNINNYNIKNDIFSNELIVRNERLLNYARTFLSTYGDLNIDWNDLGD